MKEQSGMTPSKSFSGSGNLTSLCADISPSSSNFFEAIPSPLSPLPITIRMLQVLYVGKIRVWEKHLTDTFIDAALEKFRLHELEKNHRKQIESIGRLQSEGNIFRRGSTVSLKYSN